MRLQAAAWHLRRAAPRPCGLPFALVLMTDETRQTDVVSLLERLPPRGVMPPLLVIFRHYGLPAEERAALATRAAAATRRGGHVFSLAGGGLAGAGAHNAVSAETVSVSVHDLGEALRKRALRPHLALISPVFATASHPGAPGLGPARAATIGERAGAPAFALGGMTSRNARRLEGSAFQGMAVVGAWAN